MIFIQSIHHSMQFFKIGSIVEVKRNGEWQQSTDAGIAVFEFKNGKITRLHEYWQFETRSRVHNR